MSRSSWGLVWGEKQDRWMGECERRCDAGMGVAWRDRVPIEGPFRHMDPLEDDIEEERGPTRCAGWVVSIGV